MTVKKVKNLLQAAVEVSKIIAPKLTDHWSDLIYDAETIKQMGPEDGVWIYARATGTTLYKHMVNGELLLTDVAMNDSQKAITNVALVGVRYNKGALEVVNFDLPD